jgi:signal transduction histidine kinase
MWHRTVLRLAALGAGAAVLVALVGRAAERARFGATDEGSVARVEAELGQRFDRSAATLGTTAARLAREQALIRDAARDPSAAGRLFDLLADVVPRDEIRNTGITIYNEVGTPVAWTGRVSDLPRDLIEARAALRVRPSALGPRLLRFEPVADDHRPGGARLGTVVVEQLLGEVRTTSEGADTFVLDTSLAPVTLRAALGATTVESLYRFVIRSADGQPLVEAEVSPAALAAARRRWRRLGRMAGRAVVGVTLLLCAGALLERRRQRQNRQALLRVTAGIFGLLLAARVAFWAATASTDGRAMLFPGNPVELLLTALCAAAGVWLALDTVERWRVAKPRSRPLGIPGTAWLALLPGAAAYMAAGALDAALLWAYSRFLGNLTSRPAFDLLPITSDPLIVTRLPASLALVVLHAAVIWAGVLAIRIAATRWRVLRALRPWAAACWGLGVVAALSASTLSSATRVGPFLVALGAVALCALALGRSRSRARRASQAARLGMLYLAVLVPAVALYPSMHALAIAAKERTIATEFAPLAASQREDLSSRRLPLALEQIDALAVLPDFVVASEASAAPTTDRAFLVWSRTELARYRLTSAVELYGADGQLVSQFALDLPEYTTTPYRPASCEWDLLEEVAPFGATERHVLRASRGICDLRGRRIGGIVVRAMLDYRGLPFIAGERPYLQALRADGSAFPRGGFRSDVEFAIYGWSRAPLYGSGTRVWPLPDEVFSRMVASRAPLWARVVRDGEGFRVHYLNDRGGIYAIGYPTMTFFDHLVSVAGLAALSGLLYVLFIGGATIVSALVFHTPASGRALLREVRSSFYRKLWLAFVLAAVVPVVILAIAIRTYFATQLLAGVEEAALQTATVAQRLVEDYATLQQQGAGSLELLDDQVMVLVKRAINQDVDLFTGPRLQATSQRDLFASDVLTTRTPGAVYREIAIERLPTFVGEDEVGGVPYLVAAAPVRAGGQEGIVTVPQTLRNQEIQRQIDELDRRVLFASILFVLLGAGLGYWMAERIADPVNRLTRATRRIARGDLDARVAATSSDELRRLVEDFNHMAADLKRQRAELERTQRLEAWADMARQVAHDIKNPLTPIQLSAEHARRVNLDRGRPLSPVLDECVNAILNQVQLLRQISAEFSSFASSPTARPEATDLAALVEEVVQPYRTGLVGRVVIDVQSAPDLPSVSIDRTLFSRALTNVIENALHAMPGSGHLLITARHAAKDRQVVLQVIDTGVGMDREAVAKVFEPYFSTKATGTGLGLTIAKRNVELNGGTIAVSSERGTGTTVTIALPLGE